MYQVYDSVPAACPAQVVASYLPMFFNVFMLKNMGRPGYKATQVVHAL